MQISEFKTNHYGNIDIRHGVPDGLVVANADGQTLNAAKVPYIKGLTGWGGTRKHPAPVLTNLILETDFPKLQAYIEARDAKKAKAQAKIAEVNKAQARLVLTYDFPNLDESVKAEILEKTNFNRGLYDECGLFSTLSAIVRMRFVDQTQQEGESQTECKRRIKRETAAIIESYRIASV